MSMRKIIKYIGAINLKTILLNFKYLPIRQAIHLPIWCSSKLRIRSANGKVVILGPIRAGMIRIGFDSVGIFDNKRSRSIWEVYGNVTFVDSAIIGHGSKICVLRGGELKIGQNFCITAESSVVCEKSITFGSDCLLSWDCLIMDTDFHKIKDENGRVINCPKPITFGNHVWMGCRCTVLKGVSIADNSVIAAGTLLTSSFDQKNSIIGANPNKLIKENITWQG